jgi:hypothetical protein
MEIKVLGRVRGLNADNAPESREDQQLQLNSRGDALMVQALPELTELVRMGDSWQVRSATGVAALTAEPTTANGLGLWNGEPASGKCYAIDSFGSWEAVADATQADITLMFAMQNKVPVTAPTDLALAIRSASGRSGYGGKARTFVGAVTDDGWFAHGTIPKDPNVSTAAGVQWKINEVKVKGLYLVTPGGMFNIHAVKGAAAAAAQHKFFIRWHEVQLIYKA